MKGKLTVNGPFETTDLRVLDAGLREVASGTHSINLDIEPGIYRVVAQVPGSRDEKLVLVESGGDAQVGDFKLEWDSVTPHEKSRSKHEYQTEPAEYISKQTHVSYGASPGARLFLYLRTSGEPAVALPSIRVLTGAGVVVAACPGQGEVNTAGGWAALSLTLPAGTYQIEHESSGLGRRAQAVFVEDGWQTQVFIPWLETPDVGSAVIHMQPAKQGFRHDLFWKYTETEAALVGLADRKVVLNPGGIKDFLHGKFTDPMLGLIGAYALLLSGDVNYDDLRHVSSNLQKLLPHSPDARLLKLVAETKGALPPPPETSWPVFTEPPMFAAGTARLMKQAAYAKEIVPADSWFGRIALSLTGGSAWTRWDPERESPEAIDRLKRELEVLFADSRKRAGDFVERLAQGITVGTLFGIRKEAAVGIVKALLNRAAPPLIQLLQNWKLLNIGSMIDRYGDQVAVKLAPHLELPQSVVAEALKRLMRESAPIALPPAEKRLAGGPDEAPRKPAAKKAAVKKAGARKKAPVKPASAKKAAAKKSLKRAPKKAVAKKQPAKKTAKKAPARKTPAPKRPTKRPGPKPR